MSEIKDGFQLLGVDLSDVSTEYVEVYTGVKPKVKCKNKVLQQIFVRLFGYKPTFETRLAKKIVIDSKTYPKGLNGDMSFTFSGEDLE